MTRQRRLTAAEAAEVMRLYATGEYTQAEIGARFGISQYAVSYIVNHPRKQNRRESP